MSPTYRKATAVIRPPRPEEIAELWALVGQLARYEKLEHLLTGSPEDLAAHLFARAWPPIESLVAELVGELVGYAIFYGVFSTFWVRPLLWLEDLHVTEAHRGKGIGKALLREVAKTAVARGCRRVDWAVLDWNTPSIEFYEHLGAARHSGWHGYKIEGQALAALAATSSST